MKSNTTTTEINWKKMNDIEYIMDIIYYMEDSYINQQQINKINDLLDEVYLELELVYDILNDSSK